MSYRTVSKKRFNFSWKKALLLIVFLGLVVAGLEVTDKTYFFHDKANDESVAKTTSKRPTAQSNYTKGDNKSTPTRNNIPEGGAVANTNPVSTPPTSQQVSSESGAITIYSPASEETIKSGSVVSGKASVSKVYFRLIDDAVGMIAQGPIDVTNGTFSAILQFTAQGKNGVLKLYSIDDATKREINQVKVNVKY